MVCIDTQLFRYTNNADKLTCKHIAELSSKCKKKAFVKIKFSLL